MNKYSLVSMRDLSKDDMIHILNDSLMFSNSYSDWQLPNKALIANLFFEASTRTHYSFESAELQLGCKVADVQTSASSVTKGETLYDTCKTLESAGYNALVIRSSQEFYWKELEGLNIPVLNAGDGANEHPTQCLLDLLTIYKEFGKLDGLKVVICGDVAHSRVAQSDKYAFELFGMDVKFAGPKVFEREGYPFVDFDEAIKDADVVMMLRIQKERGAASQMSDEEYLERYGMNKKRYAMLKDSAIIMHPAPVNRGVEIDSNLVEAEKSRIFQQMHNGMLVRKAVIKRAYGYAPFEESK
jgi:aspartate carbamoyltransferase catalytic subunit